MPPEVQLRPGKRAAQAERLARPWRKPSRAKPVLEVRISWYPLFLQSILVGEPKKGERRALLRDIDGSILDLSEPHHRRSAVFTPTIAGYPLFL